MKLISLRDKRGDDLLYSALVFILVNLAFFVLMFLFVARAGHGTSIYEQIYAKQIALLIDSAKPGTTFDIDISKLYELAEKSNYEGNFVEINPDENKIIVKLTDGEGYSFQHFNGASIVWGLKNEEKKLHIEIK